MREVDPLTGLRERIAEAVRVEMARARVTQRGLSERTGISQSYIGRRMTGELPFTTDDLAAIATALGVSLATLMPTEQAAVDAR